MISNIFYLWLPLKEEKKDEGQISDHSAKAVFLLSKALMKTKRKKGLNLVLGCFAKDGTVLPKYAAVSGIAKTLTLEDPAVK